MITNIANSLGIGSGLNTAQLVNDLANAALEPKQNALRARETLNSARISALASASSALGTFGTALNDLLSGANFAGTPRSSNPAVVEASLLPGGRPSQTSAAVRVMALAGPQVSRSAVYISSAATIGAGMLNISSGSASFAVSIGDPAASLADIAAEINTASANSNAGVQARVATDSAGARILINGREGLSAAFTISAGAGSSAALADLASGITQVRPASNAQIELDGLPLSFSSNSIDTAVAGLRLTLKSLSGADATSVAADIPAGGIKTLLGDFVKAYNDLRGGLNAAVAAGGGASGAASGSAPGAAGGPLAGDPGVRNMMQALGRISTTALSDAGNIRTLSDLGIQTMRDGTLQFNSARFDAAVGSNADAVRDLINPAVSTSARPGLAGMFDAVRTGIQATDGPLSSSRRKYEDAQKQYTALRQKLNDGDTRYREQLSRNFTVMERQLTILQATQSYVKQQIAAWNSGSNS